MFIIQYLPEIVVHLIVTLGVLGVIAGFLLSIIPTLRPYKLVVQLVGIVVLVFGVYLEGALANAKEWELKVKELEAKVARAETKSAKVNTVIQRQVVTKTKVVKEKAQEVVRYIDRDVVKREEVVKFVERCSLPQDIVDAHNRAVDELNKAGAKK